MPGLLLLLAASGFFSGSEAAFFSLSMSQRRKLTQQRTRSTMASSLLQRPDRLLMGILFWNLAINIAYFSLVSRISLMLPAGSSLAAIVPFGALIAIIVLGEFLPKSLSVLFPLVVIGFVAFPLTLAIRVLDAFLPVIKFVNEASRRLLWPGLRPEPYLELADLERAVELSTDDSELFEHERMVLGNLLRLSEIKVEEWMRPRTQYRSFTLPVTINSLGGKKTPSGYMLLTDSDGVELVGVVDLSRLLPGHAADLSKYQQPLVVVPWCASIAEALKKLNETSRRVAVVVNEFGETVGILTWDEIFEAILQAESGHSQRDLAKAQIVPLEDGSWLANGMTKIRRLERVMGRRLEFSSSLTVGGVVQEDLRRLPELGDVCQVADLQFEIVETGDRGEIMVRITPTSPADEADEN